MLLASADPFSHVSDNEHWGILENLGIEFHLPLGLTKFKVLILIAAGLVLRIARPRPGRVEVLEPAYS